MANGSGAAAAVYARVSTEEQAQRGTSIGDQVRRCRDTAEADGHNRVIEYVDDGVSGASASRPALDEMLAAVDAGGLGTVYVTAVDRLSRTTVQALTLVEGLAASGVGLVVLDQPGDQATASGRLSTGIYAVVAQHERERMIERTTAGLRARARGGGWPGGPAPYGYRIVDSPHGQGRVLAEDPTEAEVVRIIWRMLAVERATTGEAAIALDDAGFRSRRGGAWSAAKVRHVVRSAGPSWAGSWTYGPDEIEVAVPALVTVAEQDALTAAMDSRSTVRVSEHDYLLSGRITSPHGEAMSGTPSSSGARWYRCHHRHVSTRPDGVEQCDCHTVHADTADTQVWATVVATITGRRSLPDLLDAPGGGGDLDDTITALDERIADVESTAARELADLIDEGIDARVAARAGRRHEDRIGELRRDRDRAARTRADHARQSVATQDLAAIVAAAGTELGAVTDHATRLTVIRLLDVVVEVAGWHECPRCDGRGLVAAGLDGPRLLGSTGVVCSTCHRSRVIPRLQVRIAIHGETVPEQGKP